MLMRMITKNHNGIACPFYEKDDNEGDDLEDKDDDDIAVSVDRVPRRLKKGQSLLN